MAYFNTMTDQPEEVTHVVFDKYKDRALKWNVGHLQFRTVDGQTVSLCMWEDLDNFKKAIEKATEYAAPIRIKKKMQRK